LRSWWHGGIVRRCDPDVMYRFLAETVVLAHLAFVLFVVLGGLLALKWRRIAWAHVPAAVWGVVVEWSGRVCPLTPLEGWLRTKAGGETYAGGFVEHYIVPVLYPARLTRGLQCALGVAALVVNVLIYWRVRYACRFSQA